MESFVLYAGQWLQLKAQPFIARNGQQKNWEFIARMGTAAEFGGVSAIAVGKRDNEDFLILITNFRQPLQKKVLEFPSGFIDEGETPQEAALRELKEETGYTGDLQDIIMCSPKTYIDPWKSVGNIRMVMLKVDLERPENHNPQQNLEDDEYIEVVLVRTNNLIQNILNLAQEQDLAIDGRVMTFAMGLNLRNLLQNPNP